MTSDFLTSPSPFLAVRFSWRKNRKATPTVVAATLLFLLASTSVAQSGRAEDLSLQKKDSTTPKRRDPQVLSIAPDKLPLGAKYDVFVKRADGGTFASVSAVKPPEGSVLTVSEDPPPSLIDEGHTLVVRLEVSPAAPIGVATLMVTYEDADKKEHTSSVDVTITGKQPLAPQPTPDGIREVDVMWMVIPRKVASDNFGRRVSKQYYCVEVVIGNNSAYDLQIASVGFELKSTMISNKVPVNSYKATRATIIKDTIWNPRNIILNTVKALGPVLTGFGPFFHNVGHSANFSKAIDVFSNPFEKGIEAVYPDHTIRQLSNLDDQMLRDGLTIHNNLQVRTVVFIPKALVFSAAKPSEDPQTVMQALGRLVIIGDRIAHINREVVIATSEGGPQSPGPAVQKSTVQSAQQGAPPVEVLLTGRFLERVSVTGPEGIKISKTAVDPDGRSVRFVAEVLDSATIGPISLVVSSPDGSFVLPFQVEQGDLKVEDKTAQISQLDSTAAELKSVAEFDNKTQKAVKLIVAGAHFDGVAVTVKEPDVKVESSTVSNDGKKLTVILTMKKEKEGTVTLTINNKSPKAHSMQLPIALPKAK